MATKARRVSGDQPVADWQAGGADPRGWSWPLRVGAMRTLDANAASALVARGFDENPDGNQKSSRSAN